MTKAPESTEIQCPSEMQTLFIRINPGSVLNIVEDSTPTQRMPLNIHKRDFVRSIDFFPYRTYINPLRELDPPFAIASAIDILNRNYLWVVMDTNLEVITPQSFVVCGYWDQRMVANGLAFFHIKGNFRSSDRP